MGTTRRPGETTKSASQGQFDFINSRTLVDEEKGKPAIFTQMYFAKLKATHTQLSEIGFNQGWTPRPAEKQAALPRKTPLLPCPFQLLEYHLILLCCHCSVSLFLVLTNTCCNRNGPAPPRPAKYHCCPAPPRGSGQNCGVFAGQNENHTLNSISSDDDYNDDYEC